MAIRKHYMHSFWWSNWNKERYEQSNLAGRRHYRSRKQSLSKRYGIELTSYPDIDAMQQLYENRQKNRLKEMDRKAQHEAEFGQINNSSNE